MKSLRETTRRRHVVVNADDFGMSVNINRAILEAFQKGLISSATMIVKMPAFEDACQLIRRHGLQRRVGLHLNFTDGTPLTSAIAAYPRFCDASGFWLPRRKILRLTRKEALALEAEIAAQVQACQQNGFTPTHWDSHHHMHAEPGIVPVVIRMAKRLGVKAIRLGINCGAGREGASAFHRALASAYRSMYNSRLKFHGLARTKYFGDARDTRDILRNTRADAEVMVHPMFDGSGRLVDSDGEDLKSRIDALCVQAAEMSSYYDVAAC
jgi:predicted glycoside hydrolase/deacetylase ChbG (UPF0249 family)